MNFKEAIAHLSNGDAIKRHEWQTVHLTQHDTKIIVHQQYSNAYIWNNDIILSDNWIVFDRHPDRKEAIQDVKFCDLINYLRSDKVARLPHWMNKYIYYDMSDKQIVINQWMDSPYIILLEDILANDWEIFEHPHYVRTNKA